MKPKRSLSSYSSSSSLDPILSYSGPDRHLHFVVIVSVHAAQIPPFLGTVSVGLCLVRLLQHKLDIITHFPGHVQNSKVPEAELTAPYFDE
jgi:hypothetical protein